ncbi:TM2 domain-containing protein [Bifidobacterium xylocopae]|uniref:TM2 domain-containing protein n=1 Tax=Bifidobacterium xylocopae TaxID=2493119 RepID=A0A366KBP3_9BIFI|nr:TM2 domain-containing protein [Bifidobacterium xylocopae]RBP99094.1 hypothetical protein CRD59_05440 [Bifidobacterium xylocopae]
MDNDQQQQVQGAGQADYGQVGQGAAQPGYQGAPYQGQYQVPGEAGYGGGAYGGQQYDGQGYSAQPAAVPQNNGQAYGPGQQNQYQGQYQEPYGGTQAQAAYQQYGQPGQQQYGQNGAYGQGSYGQYGPYGQQAPQVVSPKSKVAAGLLAIFLGSLGIHNFYLGRTSRGVCQLVLTVVGWIVIVGPVISSIWALVEGILILCSHPGSFWHQDANGREFMD